MRRLALGVAGALALGACGDNLAREPVVLTGGGGLEVRVHEVPARIEVVKDGAVIWSTLPGLEHLDDPPAVFAAARFADPTVQMQFGAFRFDPDGDAPWTAVATLAVTAVDAGELRFDLRGRTSAALGQGSIKLLGEEVVLALDLAPTGGTRASLGFACADDEHFLGLGGQSFAVDHRGQDVALWVQEDGIGKRDVADDDYIGVWALEGRRHSTHTPMPMMLSSRGWALALATDRRAIFELCTPDAPDVARLEAWDDQLELHLFVGADPKASVGLMTGWVGRPAVPPAFAFAPWLDAIYGEGNVRRVADKLRSEDIPVSVIWSEDWRGGNDENGAAGGYVLEEDWRVDRDIYPDFEGLADHLHGTGFKFLTYANTFLDIEADVRPEAIQLGHTIKKADGSVYDFTGVKFRDSTLLDLTSPAAVAWAKDVYDDAFAIGSDGWMADFAEWLPTDAVLASGEDALHYHNRYATDWIKLNHELFAEAQARDGVERLFFARSAALGAQPYMQVLWAGDQQTDFTLGDGLPSVIPMGIGLGITGFPYFGHDIAGYMSTGTVPVTRELWFRWVSFGALSPVMRTHHGRSARQNWNWESDPESTAHLRRWAKLHMQLVPYQRAMAAEAAAHGTPLFRPFALDWPAWAPGWSLTDQYLLGDRIAVAPVIVEGATSRAVQLPPGRWYGLLDGAELVSDGATPVTVAASVSEIPAFVPACTLLALYPDTVDTVVATAAGSPIVGAADVEDDRVVQLWPCDGADRPSARLVEAGGALRYTRTAVPLRAGDAATWNGQAVTFTIAGGWATADVVGPGTLAVAGQPLLTIEGGAPDRRLRLRIAVAS